MCGIVGSIGHEESRVISSLKRMVHRGPDGEGIWRLRDIIFGHRRLAIIDLSQNGKQPMTDPTRRVTITFNGEIYNYIELKKDLENEYHFRGHSDTEVLLAGYLAWGIEELLRRIRGMFAFALWDEQDHSLYLARDPFGKKPLYYTTLNGKFAFASSLNSLHCFWDRTPDLNYTAIDDYFTYMSVPGEKTIYQNVFKLRPAHYAVYRENKLDVRRYWNLSFQNQYNDITENEALDEIEKLLRQSVRRRMISDVPIGAFLSGGVDSSLVAAIMAQESKKQITTLTMGFNDPTYDERPYARIVAKYYNTNHQEEVLSSDMWRQVPKILKHFGEPFADSSAIPTYFIAQFARKHVTVVLNGDGGDELFAGYTRPLVEALAISYRKYIFKELREQLGVFANNRPKLRPRILNGMKQVLITGATDAKAAFVFDRALRSYRNQLYTDDFFKLLEDYHPDQWYQKAWDEADGPTSVDKAMYGDLITYLPDELLPKMDSMTMAHSLEARSPLLDVDLAEFVAKIPYKLKVQGLDTKMLLKKLASRHVPSEVLFRPKKGFNMPIGNWLRNELISLLPLAHNTSVSGKKILKDDKIEELIKSVQNGEDSYVQPIWTIIAFALGVSSLVEI